MQYTDDNPLQHALAAAAETVPAGADDDDAVAACLLRSDRARARLQ